jgi:hypothetical protein
VWSAFEKERAEKYAGIALRYLFFVFAAEEDIQNILTGNAVLTYQASRLFQTPRKAEFTAFGV